MAILAIEHPVFQPAMRIISSISNSFPVEVTTTFDHNYITGTIIRLDIPPGYTMQQINQQFGPITVTSDTTFTIPIDTTQYDVFVAPSAYPYSYQYAQCIPFAEINSILTAATQNVLPYPAT
jgi:hypothetical protein